MLQMDSVMAEW